MFVIVKLIVVSPHCHNHHNDRYTIATITASHHSKISSHSHTIVKLLPHHNRIAATPQSNHRITPQSNRRITPQSIHLHTNITKTPSLPLPHHTTIESPHHTTIDTPSHHDRITNTPHTIITNYTPHRQIDTLPL